MSAGEASFLLAYFYSLYRVARNCGFTQGTHTVVLFENMYFYYTVEYPDLQMGGGGGGGGGGGHPDPHWHVLNKNENIINAGYWVLPKHRKK